MYLYRLVLLLHSFTDNIRTFGGYISLQSGISGISNRVCKQPKLSALLQIDVVIRVWNIRACGHKRNRRKVKRRNFKSENTN